jgi:hypothetical protein
LGGAPNAVGQPQKILLAVSSWAWISSPITASKESDLKVKSSKLKVKNLGQELQP